MVCLEMTAERSIWSYLTLMNEIRTREVSFFCGQVEEPDVGSFLGGGVVKQFAVTAEERAVFAGFRHETTASSFVTIADHSVKLFAARP